MSTWKIIESFLSRVVLPEEKMYRGETLVRMKDLESLFRELSTPDKKTGKIKSSDPKAAGSPDPGGGSITCTYPVDPRVWGRWSPSLNFAKILAGTDKQDTQYQGQPKGGMVVKKNYGGRVMHQPGPTSREPDKYGSAMDRYDVLMVADVEGGAIEPGQNVNWSPTQKQGTPSITVHKIVWSPAMGTAEERQARLEGLLNGSPVQALRRRPQPHVPVPDPDMNQDVPAPIDVGRRR